MHDNLSFMLTEGSQTTAVHSTYSYYKLPSTLQRLDFPQRKAGGSRNTHLNIATTSMCYSKFLPRLFSSFSNKEWLRLLPTPPLRPNQQKNSSNICSLLSQAQTTISLTAKKYPSLASNITRINATQKNKKLHLAGFFNRYFRHRLAPDTVHAVHRPHDLQPLGDPPKRYRSPVQMASRFGGDVELRAVRVQARVSHRKEARRPAACIHKIH